MIRTAHEQQIVCREARTWRDKLKRLRRLSDTEAADLAHCLDELQHAVSHQITYPAPKGGR
jgi:hypothetical protein